MRTFLLAVVGVVLATKAARAEEPIAYGEGGVRIGEAVVVAKPVTAAAYDEALDLVWINTKGTLQVIDLRISPPKATVIAKKMPEGGFDIAGGSTATSGNVYSMVFPVLNTAKARFTSAEGAYGELDMDLDAEKVARKAIKKIKVVGKKWLKTLKKRKPHAAPGPADRKAVGKVTLPAGMGQCDDDSCGELEAFGATAYQLVVVEQSCGDACFMGCALYDPRTKKFASTQAATSSWGATAEAGACDGYAFSADNTAYLIGTNRCTIAKGITCTDDTPWGYLGWTAPAAP